MYFFHFIPLEERIVLDATLVSTFLNPITLEGNPLDASTANSIDGGIRFSIVLGDGIPTQAHIDWGDGSSSSSFQVQGQGGGGGIGNFIFDPSTIESNHIYQDPGIYDMRLVFDVGSVSPLTFGQATVNDQPLTLVSAPDISLVEGATTHKTFFTFTDGDPSASASEFQVSYQGLSSSGVISNLAITETGPNTSTFVVSGDILLKDVDPGAIVWTVHSQYGSTLNAVNSLNVSDAPIAISANSFSGVEGEVLTQQVLATFQDSNPYPEMFAISNYLGSSVSISNTLIEDNGNGNYLILGDIHFLNRGSYNPNFYLTDAHDGTDVNFSVAINAANAPLLLQESASIVGTQGDTAAHVLLGKFTNAVNNDPLSASVSSSLVSVDNISIVLDPVQGGSGFLYDVYGDVHFLQDSVGQTVDLVVTAIDGEGATLAIHDTLRVFDQPLVVVEIRPVLGEVLTPLVEGTSSDGYILLFSDPEAGSSFNVNDYKATIDWGDGQVTVGGPGEFIQTLLGDPENMQLYALHTYTDTGLYAVHVTIFDVASGDTILMAQTSADVQDAPLHAGNELTITANQGALFSGVVGSFFDENPFSLASDFTATIDWGDGSSSLGVVVVNGGGGFNILGDHTYLVNPDGLQGAIHIADPHDGSMLDGSFLVAGNAVQQLLWGVDQATGQLFSVGDYSLPGAENRVTLYGQLETTLGTVIGNKIYAFAIDGQDALGANAAFIAVSKPLDGINTFSIGLIDSINDAGARTEVTLFAIKGITFDVATDKITGLAIDPLTGNLQGLIVREYGAAALFVVNKNDLNQASTTHTVQGYVLGKIVGEELFGVPRISNAQDLIFDQAHNLYVTDANGDRLFRINNNTGEILGVVNRNEDLGIGEADIKALAYDPILNKIVGANAILDNGMPANDLVGLSIHNDPNTIDVHLLSQLKDIQGMAFVPQFAERGGADLGLLIDVKETYFDYYAGSGPLLLLRDVNLIDFGDKSYDGVSLKVDVLDNPNALTDLLNIAGGDGIQVNRTTGAVYYWYHLIGTIDGVENGKNGQALTIHFNANATEKAVETVMERLTYMNSSRSLIGGERIIEITLYDELNNLIAYTTIDLDVKAGWSWWGC